MYSIVFTRRLTPEVISNYQQIIVKINELRYRITTGWYYIDKIWYGEWTNEWNYKNMKLVLFALLSIITLSKYYIWTYIFANIFVSYYFRVLFCVSQYLLSFSVFSFYQISWILVKFPFSWLQLPYLLYRHFIKTWKQDLSLIHIWRCRRRG